VFGGHHARVDVNAHLDDPASGDAKIVPLEIGARDARLLRPRHVQRQTASDEQHRYRHDACRLHVYSFLTQVPIERMRRLTMHASVFRPVVMTSHPHAGLLATMSAGSETPHGALQRQGAAAPTPRSSRPWRACCGRHARLRRGQERWAGHPWGGPWCTLPVRDAWGALLVRMPRGVLARGVSWEQHDAVGEVIGA